MARVTDNELLARLRREARPGDEAEFIIEQRLSPDGMSIVLKDYCPVGEEVAVG
jgi:hypothetical protein